MEGVNLHELPRKELKKLCIEHGIRTAGVKREDLVRLLCTRVLHAASHPSRITKSRTPTSKDPQLLTNVRGESPEKTTTKSIFLRRSLCSLAIVDGPVTDDKFVWCENDVSSNPALSRTTILTKSNSFRARQSDLVDKVDDVSSPLNTFPEDLMQQKFNGSPAKGRGSFGARKQNVKRTLTEVRLPDGYLRVKLNEIPKVLKSEDACSEAATNALGTENGAYVTVAGSIDLESHCFHGATEFSTDARHHFLSSESGLHDDRSVSSEVICERQMQTTIVTSESDRDELVTSHLGSNSGGSLFVDKGPRRPISEETSVAHDSEALLRMKLLASFNIFSTSNGNPHIERQHSVADAGNGIITTYAQNPGPASDQKLNLLQGSEAEHFESAFPNSGLVPNIISHWVENIHSADLYPRISDIEKPIDMPCNKQSSVSGCTIPSELHNSTVVSEVVPDSAIVKKVDTKNQGLEVYRIKRASDEGVNVHEANDGIKETLMTHRETTQNSQATPVTPFSDEPDDHDDCGNHENSRVTLITATKDADNTKFDDFEDGIPMRNPSDSVRNCIEDSEPFLVKLDSKKLDTEWDHISASLDDSKVGKIKGVEDSNGFPELKLTAVGETGHNILENIDRITLPRTQFKATPSEIATLDIEAANAGNDRGASESHFFIPLHLDSLRFPDDSLDGGIVVNVSQENTERGLDNEEGESIRLDACTVAEAMFPAPGEGESSRSSNCSQKILDGLSSENKAAAFNFQTTEEREESFGVRSMCEEQEDAGVLIQAQALARVAAVSTDLKEYEFRHPTVHVMDTVNVLGDGHSMEKLFDSPASDKFEEACQETEATPHPGKRESILAVGFKMAIVFGSLIVGILKLRASKRRLEEES